MRPYIKLAAVAWAHIICRHASFLLIIAGALTVLAITRAASINLSTDIDALMPKQAKSVQTLNSALEKTGSFASIQIVVQSADPKASLDFISAAKKSIDIYEWVGTSQYYEDIEVLSRHRLLLLSVDELLERERDTRKVYPTLIAKEISKATGVDATIVLRNKNLSGMSITKLDDSKLNNLLKEAKTPKSKRQNFVSEDGLTAVLIIWPKPGYNSLASSKRMVNDAHQLVAELTTKMNRPDIQAGVAGRIASQVLQFESIIKDLKLGLLGAVSLIILLLIWSYRSVAVVPIIFIPLIVGIIWTLGVTAITIGGLNLITVFLILILFGLGIDFGIHNTSRYIEERRKGQDIQAAITIVITETGSASLIAALTTACAFFALMLTEFRAFTEFGFIAGSGILLTFIAMYSILPALLVIMDKWWWEPSKPSKVRDAGADIVNWLRPLSQRRPIIIVSFGLCLFAIVFAPQMRFESNMKNLEASMPSDHVTANLAVKQVIKSSNSRAIIVAKTWAELVAIDFYFKDKIKTDTQTPTIKRVSSILDFVPDQLTQKKRLNIIRRLEMLADDLKDLDPETYMAGKPYLSIDALNIADLPRSLRRSFLGTNTNTGYLVYVDNAVTMDDARLAKQFYDDVASFQINGKNYYSASEGFILVEMLALMKADALKAIALVILTTSIVILLFFRNLTAAFVVLLPPLIGIFVTIGIMGAFGPSLSIMNMVILPSLVGISVDNGIHIFHRFQHDIKSANVSNIMQTTGRAAVLTTMTTLIGFGGMITASMGGLRSMAILAIIGFLSCLFMTWFLLPVILEALPEEKN